MHIIVIVLWKTLKCQLVVCVWLELAWLHCINASRKERSHGQCSDCLCWLAKSALALARTSATVDAPPPISCVRATQLCAMWTDSNRQRRRVNTLGATSSSLWCRIKQHAFIHFYVLASICAHEWRWCWRMLAARLPHIGRVDEGIDKLSGNGTKTHTNSGLCVYVALQWAWCRGHKPHKSQWMGESCAERCIFENYFTRAVQIFFSPLFTTTLYSLSDLSLVGHFRWIRNEEKCFVVCSLNKY